MQRRAGRVHRAGCRRGGAVPLPKKIRGQIARPRLQRGEREIGEQQP